METITNFKKLWLLLCILAISVTTYATDPPCTVPGNALDFDGTNDYVNIGNVSSLNFERTDAFSIEAWVKYTSTGAQMIYSKMNNGEPFGGYELWTNNGNVSVYLINVWTVNNIFVRTNTAPLADGQWHHVAMTYSGNSDASGVNIYVDGVLQVKTVIYNTLTASIQTTAPAQIGARASIDYFWEGTMDEVRIWSTERTGTEIQTNMNSELSTETGLVAAYHFNQGIADGNNAGVTTATDASGNSNDGTLNNFALTGSTSNWVAGTVSTGSGFTVNLKDSNGDLLAGGSLEYREGGGSGWQNAPETTDGVFCFYTERSKVGLRMTYGPQIKKVVGVPTNSEFTFQTVDVTVELSDGGSPVDGGEVAYTAYGWHNFGITGDDGAGTGTVSDEMLPAQYTFRMKYDGDKENKTELISTSNNLITFDVADLKSSIVDGEDEFQLTAYPNPFSGNATIAFTLEEAQEINISVYDQTGRLIEVLHVGIQPEGNHKFSWDANNVNKGVYFVRLSTNGKVSHKNIVKM